MEKIQSGVFIQTRDEMISEQKDWDEDDPCKDTDFTCYPFWMTTDDGVMPEGFDSVDDARKSLK